MKVGEKIKKLRKQHGLTLVQLGELINLKKSTVSKYENGEINIPSDKLEKIARVLDTSPQYLLGFDENIEVVDIDILNEEQKKELDIILSTNNIMFFKGTKANKENYELLKNSIAKVYIKMLKDNNEI